MAFLTYRQSDQTVTDAQNLRQNVILGVPLTMYHVDANFKAINDELVAYREKYGLGIATGDNQLTIAQSFGSNDANLVANTGFYRLSATTNAPAGIDNSVLIHAQNSTGSVTDVTAIQLTAGVGSNGGQILYYRTKLGQNTWNAWQSFASAGDVDISIEGLREQIAKCVLRAGDTMTGQLTLENKLRLTGNNEMISTSVRKGVTPSTSSTDGFTVYDNTGIANESTKLGFFGLKQSSDSFSGISISAVNPTGIGSTQTNEFLVGWKQDDSGTYQPYTYVPTPVTDDPNQIANIEWVQNEIDIALQENGGSIVNDGGTIHGDLIVDGNITINNSMTAVDADFSGNVTFDNPTGAIIDYAKGQVPSSTDRVAGSGYRIVDSTGNTALTTTGGELWGEIDYLGNFTTKIAAYNWEATTSADQVKQANISVTISRDGNTITTHAPTPPDGDSSTQIATTEWTQKNVETTVNQMLTDFDNDHPWDLGIL